MATDRKSKGNLRRLFSKRRLPRLGNAAPARRDLGRDDRDRAAANASLPASLVTHAIPDNVVSVVGEFIVTLIYVDGPNGEDVPTIHLRTLEGLFVAHLDPRDSEAEEIAVGALEAECLMREVSN